MDVDCVEGLGAVDVEVSRLFFVVVDSRIVHIGDFIETNHLVEFRFFSEAFFEGFVFEVF